MSNPTPFERTVVVVPTYNEGAMVGTVVTELREVFPHVVCVDDGSRDDSAQAARAAGATVLRHPVTGRPVLSFQPRTSTRTSPAPA